MLISDRYLKKLNLKLNLCHFLFQLFNDAWGMKGLYFQKDFLQQRSWITISNKIIPKLSFLILNIAYFLMLMNNWQPFSKLVRGMSCVSYLCFFCLHTINCQSIPTFTQAWSYLVLKIFHTTCIWLSVYLYDWSNPNMSLTHLTRTIRTISGDCM